MTSREKPQKLISYVCKILTVLLGIRLLIFPIFEIPDTIMFNLSIFILVLLLGILYQYDLYCIYKNIEQNIKGKLLIVLISVIIWIFIFITFYIELYRFL